VRQDVLVESFEPGAAIQGYVAASAACAARAAVAALAPDAAAAAAAAAALPSDARGAPLVSAARGPCQMAAAADAAIARPLSAVAAAAAARSSEHESARLRGAIAEAGMHVYLKMLLKDNFIHAGVPAGGLLRVRVGVFVGRGGVWGVWGEWAPGASVRQPGRTPASAGGGGRLPPRIPQPRIPPPRTTGDPPPRAADMHPGNILVREVDRSGGVAERCALLLKQLSAGLPLPGLREVFRNVVLPPTPQLVLLDTGMIAELSAADQRSVVDFFRVRAALRGARAAPPRWPAAG
jgi:hypothetical protein